MLAASLSDTALWISVIAPCVSFAGALIYQLWRIARFLSRLVDKLDALAAAQEKQAKESWMLPDHRVWSTRLGDLNKGLIVPPVQKVVEASDAPDFIERDET